MSNGNFDLIYQQVRIDSESSDKYMGINSGILQFCDIVKYNQADDTEKLMSRINKSYIPRNFVPKQMFDENICPICKQKNVIVDDDNFICINCNTHMGYQTNTDVDNKYSEKSQSHIKMKHFLPILDKLQGHMIKPILDSEMMLIEEHLNRMISTPTGFTYKAVQRILKSINLQQHYCNIPYIIRILKKRTMYITQYQRIQMISMFQRMGDVYKKYTTSRVNTISYDYIVYKFCQILGITGEIIDNLRLIKDAHIKYDAIWNKIVNELEWEFIPT